jgi:membrane dipeptidase
MAYNALTWKRDLSRAAHYTRQREQGTPAQKHNGHATVGLPDLIRGRVGLVFGTIFCQPRSHQMSPHELTYGDEQEAHIQGMAQLDFYRRWEERDPKHVKVVRYRKDLEEVLRDWRLEIGDLHLLNLQSPISNLSHRLGIVPLMENADPIREPKELELWYEKGIRIIGPAWDTTRYAGGTWQGGGLTKLGRELLSMMAQFNVILDVSHLSHKSLYESLDAFEGQHVIASHSNPHRFVPTERHLPDPAIERIAERNGVIGVVIFNKFLTKDWSGKKIDVTLDHVIRAIDHICQVTGSANHVGIGSDFDGGYGAEATPRELDTARDFHKIGDELLQRGYQLAHVQQIMYGNWVRKLREALP